MHCGRCLRQAGADRALLLATLCADLNFGSEPGDASSSRPKHW